MLCAEPLHRAGKYNMFLQRSKGAAGVVHCPPKYALLGPLNSSSHPHTANSLGTGKKTPPSHTIEIRLQYRHILDCVAGCYVAVLPCEIPRLEEQHSGSSQLHTVQIEAVSIREFDLSYGLCGEEEQCRVVLYL